MVYFVNTMFFNNFLITEYTDTFLYMLKTKQCLKLTKKKIGIRIRIRRVKKFWSGSTRGSFIALDLEDLVNHQFLQSVLRWGVAILQLMKGRIRIRFFVGSSSSFFLRVGSDYYYFLFFLEYPSYDFLEKEKCFFIGKFIILKSTCYLLYGKIITLRLISFHNLFIR